MTIFLIQPDYEVEHRELSTLNVELDPHVDAVIAAMDLHISFTKEPRANANMTKAICLKIFLDYVMLR